MPGWQKLTVDWPCALGDFLWSLLVVRTAKWLNDLTLKRAIMTAGMVLIVIAVAQTLPADIAIIFAGDTMAYFEIASAVMLIAVRGRVYMSLRVTVDMLCTAAARIASTTHQAFRRAPRRPIRHMLQRLFDADDTDGDAAVAFA
jgi:hypothetical protein